MERHALSVSVRTRVGATIPDLESEVVALKGDVTCASLIQRRTRRASVGRSLHDQRVRPTKIESASDSLGDSAPHNDRTDWHTYGRSSRLGRLSAVALVRMAWKRSARVPPVCS